MELFSASSFSPDGEFLYYGSDQDSEFQRIWSYEIATGDRQVVEEREWDIQGMSFTRDKKFRLLATNVDAHTELEVRVMICFGESWDTLREVRIRSYRR